MKTKFLRLFVISAALVGALVVLAPHLSIARAATNANPAVYPPSAVLYGKTYQQWTAIWYKWYLAQPNESSPAFDPTGDRCGNSQNRQIFMLAGSGDGAAVTRACTIPYGKRILVPVITAECSNVESELHYGLTADDRATCAKGLISAIDTANISVKVDGVTIHNPGRYHFTSPDFRFTIPATDNVLGVTGHTTGAATSDGYWLLLRTLPRGTHKVEWKVTTTGSVLPAQDVTYNLTIK